MGSYLAEPTGVWGDLSCLPPQIAVHKATPDMLGRRTSEHVLVLFSRNPKQHIAGDISCCPRTLVGVVSWP